MNLLLIINLIIFCCLITGVITGVIYFKRKIKDLRLDEQTILDEVTEQVNEIEATLNASIDEIRQMNSVVFDCPCSHNTVRTFIDLSKPENTFICPECKNEYRIDITMVPILKGKIVDEQGMYKLLTSSLEKARL